MQLTVNKFRNITTADINLARGVNLIAGTNGQGKSSLLAAAAACANYDTALPQGMRKKDAGDLVQEMESRGSVSLDGRMICFPSTSSSGPAPFPHAPSLMALGRVEWQSMPVSERIKSMMRLTPGAEITRQDLETALTEVKNKKFLGSVLPMAENLDAIFAMATKSITECTGAWKQATGQTFGAVKAAGWVPDGWYDGLADATPATLADDLYQAKDRLMKGVATQAVGEHVIEELRAVAGQELPDLADAEKQMTDAQEGSFDIGVGKGDEEPFLQILEQQKAKILALNVEPEDIKSIRMTVVKLESDKAGLLAEYKSLEKNAPLPTLPCPYCEEPIVVNAIRQLSKPEPVDLESREKRMADLLWHGKSMAAQIKIFQDSLAELDAEQKQKKADLQAGLQQLENFRTDRRASARIFWKQQKDKYEKILTARADLDRLQSASTTPEQLAALQQAVEKAEKNKIDYHQKTQADLNYSAWIDWQLVRSVAAPEGLRQQKMGAALASINEQLAAICLVAQWRTVSLDADGGFFLDGRQYVLLSESEKFRCRATLQILFAQVEKSEMVIVDGVDILDIMGRYGLCKMLATLDAYVLVGMTGKKEQADGLATYCKQIIVMDKGAAKNV